MRIEPWNVGVAAEAFAAAVFARCGYKVSVQYGANQPEYDLMVDAGDKMLKISVKGSQDGSWGLTQSHLKDKNYYKAVDIWLSKHHKHTIFCLVQLKDVALMEMPRIYLASPEEIAERLKASAGGRGETILYEYHKWTARAAGQGTIDKIPDDWKFSKERAEEMINLYG